MARTAIPVHGHPDRYPAMPVEAHTPERPGRRDPYESVTAPKDPESVVVGGTVLERPDWTLCWPAETPAHARPNRDRLRPVPDDEQVVGDDERTNFGHTDAVTRVASRVDTGGYLVAADIPGSLLPGADLGRC